MGIRKLVLICFVIIKYSDTIGLSKYGTQKFIELISKYGHTAKEYDVITEDGYILKLFHIPGERKVPVLLMHGITEDSGIWIMRGKRSLAITLANQGYDVWIGNCRGNRYSRSHVHLNPNEPNDGFWNFTFEESGFYDLVAIIDRVLLIAGAKKLNAIGHSQGNTIFYILGSMRPKYNDKVNVLIALGPICYLQNVQGLLNMTIDFSPIIYNDTEYFKSPEIFGDNALLDTWRMLCSTPNIGYRTCVLGIIFPITGYDEEELEANFLPTFVKHIPSGTSLKSLNHFGQVGLRKKFARYDYGTKLNLAIYNSPVPPEYDLNAITMKIALLVAANDRIATVKDVELLRGKLPNVVQYTIIPRKMMNHIDFISGLHMKEYLFPYILDILNSV